MKHKVIGIDLGTSYSAVAAFDTFTQKTGILLNREEGASLKTPSVVGLDPRTGKIVVGASARRDLPLDPFNTIIEVKREIGALLTPALLERYGAPPEYEGASAGQRQSLPLKLRLANRWFLPQEICAFILMKMKEVAEQDIGEEVRDAVITVPAWFTASQRKAMEEAALLAGLYPRQLIPEPTAAAICYGAEFRDPDRHVYLVYDLGGGTFDVSIISVQEDDIKVIAASGNPRLGGCDFDDRITAWAIEQLRKTFGVDYTHRPDVWARIKHHAEQAKIRLSRYEVTELGLTDIDAPESGRAFSLSLDRSTFVGLIDDYLQKSMEPVEEAINLAWEKCGYQREDISAILLVGGSTNIPAVKQRLLQHFGRDEDFIRDDLDPAAVVARGAAMLAHRFNPTPPPFDPRRRPAAMQLNRDAPLSDVALITEHTLGLAAFERGQIVFDPLIERGTSIPVSCTRELTNSGPSTELDVPVYQGESAFPQENTLVGIVHLGPMQPLPAGQHRFQVTSSLDANGILSVLVNHVNEGRTYTARLDQPTTSGGEEALAALRGELLLAYQPGRSTSRTDAPRAPGMAAGTLEYMDPEQATSVFVDREGAGTSEHDESGLDAGPVPLDESVQFTVYQPGTVLPAEWYPLLAFAHLSELPPGEHGPSPHEQVEQQAAQVLQAEGRQPGEFQPFTQPSRAAVPREGELSFVPNVPGLDFNPAIRTFEWRESVHREEFRFRASPALDGRMARGQLSVFHGSIILAEIALAIRVDSRHTSSAQQAQEAVSAKPFRKIFASYSRRDEEIVKQVERRARRQALGDEYWRDLTAIHAGEVWNERLEQMIRESDIFQLFWSRNSMRSDFVRQEWEYAFSLRRPHFVRPTYWEEPFPEDSAIDLPPERLRRLHFVKIRVSASPTRPRTDHDARYSAHFVDAPDAVEIGGPVRELAEAREERQSAEWTRIREHAVRLRSDVESLIEAIAREAALPVSPSLAAPEAVGQHLELMGQLLDRVMELRARAAGFARGAADVAPAAEVDVLQHAHDSIQSQLASGHAHLLGRYAEWLLHSAEQARTLGHPLPGQAEMIHAHLLRIERSARRAREWVPADARDGTETMQRWAERERVRLERTGLVQRGEVDPEREASSTADRSGRQRSHHTPAPPLRRLQPDHHQDSDRRASVSGASPDSARRLVGRIAGIAVLGAGIWLAVTRSWLWLFAILVALVLPGTLITLLRAAARAVRRRR
jgi:molecular chaperone DnaK (HSP70)